MIFFFLLFLFLSSIILLTNIFNKFNDGFEVKIVNAVLHALVMRKGIIMAQETFK